MDNIVVTLKSNLKLDQEGIIELTEEGEPILLDENDIGILAKTHIIPIQTEDLEKGIKQSGFVTRLEIYWNLHRSPAPAMLDPSEVAWLTYGEEDEDDEEDFVDEEQEIRDV